jgi:hypothetical protein
MRRLEGQPPPPPGETGSTWDVLHKYPHSEYKVIFVGDATMSPYEITYPGGSVEHWNEEPAREKKSDRVQLRLYWLRSDTGGFRSAPNLWNVGTSAGAAGVASILANAPT